MPLSELTFGSYLTYTPRGNNTSRDIMLAIKSESSVGDPPQFISKFVTEKIANQLPNMPFKGFFSPNTCLIPVPKTTLMQPNTLWVSSKIAQEFSKRKLGVYCECLKRISPLPKAAFAPQGMRPSAHDHFQSLECQLPLNKPTEIVLIDDIITRGATLIGCANRIRASLPNASIKAFAVMRTVSNPNDFKQIIDPCVGTIKNYSHGTFREP